MNGPCNAPQETTAVEPSGKTSGPEDLTRDGTPDPLRTALQKGNPELKVEGNSGITAYHPP